MSPLYFLFLSESGAESQEVDHFRAIISSLCCQIVSNLSSNRSQKIWKNRLPIKYSVKGTVLRDFQPFFFMNQSHLGHRSTGCNIFAYEKFVNMCMRHSAESQLCAMRHSKVGTPYYAAKCRVFFA
jgi:hypothetical protein